MFTTPRTFAALRARLPRRLLGTLTALAFIAVPAGAMAARYLFSDRVEAHDVNFHVLPVSGAYVAVRGDGTTDLDCFLFKNGQLVDSDEDGTDYCVLSTDGLRAPYTLAVRNFGSVYNDYTVRIE